MSPLKAPWDGSSRGQDVEGELDEKELLWKVEREMMMENLPRGNACHFPFRL